MKIKFKSKKFLLVPAMFFISAACVFAESSMASKKFFLEAFLGATFYHASKIGETDVTVDMSSSAGFGGGGEHYEFTGMDMGIDNVSGMFSNIGISAAYMFTQRFGLGLDFLWYPGGSMSGEQELIAGINSSGQFLSGIIGYYGNDLTIDGTKLRNSDVDTDGFFAAFGPAFRFFEGNLFLSPKLSIRKYWLNGTLKDIFMLGSNVADAKYNLKYDNTDLGLLLQSDFKFSINDTVFWSIKLNFELGFYQIKSIKEEVRIGSDSLNFNVQTGKAIFSFAFTPIFGIGMVF